MTVSSTVPYVKYACTGTDEYTYSFKIFEDADLLVKRISTTGAITNLVLTTDYTVADNGDGSGGTVTTVSTYSDGHVSIELNLSYDQETEFSDGGPLPSEQLENALDRNVMLVKQLQTLISDGALGITWQGGWTTSTSYAVFDMVTNSGKWYVCAVAHTSDVFATDLSSGYWRLFLEEPSSHAIASHSDTTATGTELETLTDDSMADALHRHSELSASDGTPSPALSVDAAGLVSLINGTGINEFSTDGTLVGNSDTAVPTEKAVKSYSDNNAKFYDAYLRYTEYTADGVDGGDSTTGSWVVRVLNREDRDTGSIGSLSTGQVTIPAGTYRMSAFSHFYGSGSVTLRLYDHTGAATLLHGSTKNTGASTSDTVELSGSFTISSTSAVSVQYQCGTSNSGDGLGDDSFNVYSDENIWTQLELWREA